MPTHHFTLIVDGADLQDEAVVDSLFESGCDDGLVGSVDDTQFIDFDREAPSLGDAVLSAVADVERTDGVQVIHMAGVGLRQQRHWLDAGKRNRLQELAGLSPDSTIADEPG